MLCVVCCGALSCSQQVWFTRAVNLLGLDLIFLPFLISLLCVQCGLDSSTPIRPRHSHQQWESHSAEECRGLQRELARRLGEVSSTRTRRKEMRVIIYRMSWYLPLWGSDERMMMLYADVTMMLMVTNIFVNWRHFGFMSYQPPVFPASLGPLYLEPTSLLGRPFISTSWWDACQYHMMCGGCDLCVRWCFVPLCGGTFIVNPQHCLCIFVSTCHIVHW